jgi:hypothetical protein
MVVSLIGLYYIRRDRKWDTHIMYLSSWQGLTFIIYITIHPQLYGRILLYLRHTR